MFPVKSEEVFFQNNDCPASSFPDLLASCCAVLVMRIQFSLSLLVRVRLISCVRLLYPSFSCVLVLNLSRSHSQSTPFVLPFTRSLLVSLSLRLSLSFRVTLSRSFLSQDSSLFTPSRFLPNPYNLLSPYLSLARSRVWHFLSVPHTESRVVCHRTQGWATET